MMAPATRARLVLWGLLLVNLGIVEVMFWTYDPAKNTLIGVARFLGLHAALVMILQLVLIARIPWLDRRIGMDRLTSWHRWTGFTLFWLVLAHPAFILVGYGRLDHVGVFEQFTTFVAIPQTLYGICAAAIIVVAAGLSVRAARRRMSYETWHAIHFLLYAAVALALVHQLFEGSTFKASVLTAAYWWTLWTLAGLALLAGRVILPLWRNARHRFRVAAVVPESDNVVSVHVTGRRLDRLPAQAGQFFLWRFPGHGHWWQVNPFSLSRAPDGQSLRLTAKAAGKTSAGLRGLPVGTRVFAEGPYGAFTAGQRTRDASLLIAGGVGITPVRALLEVLPGPVVVLYRVPTAADAVLLDELRELAAARGARLHLLTGRTGSGDPPRQPFAPASLEALVPDLRDRDAFVCGPPAMTSAVLRSLRQLGVPRRQLHAERFSLGA